MRGLNDKILDQYEYSTDPVLKKYLHAWDRLYIGAMISYDRDVSNFGKQMTAHQNRVAKDGAAFLRYLGYSERAAGNFRAAMLFHDIGKTHSSYNPMIWSLLERPTDEEKALRIRHAQLGAEMWESFAAERPDLITHPHFHVRHALTLYHHERTDGTGPEGAMASSLPVFVQVACIVDAYDGDRIPRNHQDHRRTPREALQRMMGIDDPKGKYAGAFHSGLLAKYVKMKVPELAGSSLWGARFFT